MFPAFAQRIMYMPLRFQGIPTWGTLFTSFSRCPQTGLCLLPCFYGIYIPYLVRVTSFFRRLHIGLCIYCGMAAFCFLFFLLFILCLPAGLFIFSFVYNKIFSLRVAELIYIRLSLLFLFLRKFNL